MGKFKVVSEYTPSGDQPQAIDTPVSYTHLTLPTN